MNDNDRTALSIILTALAVIFIGLRFFVRYWRADPLVSPRWTYFIADGMCVIATIGTVMYCSIYCWQLQTVYQEDATSAQAIGLISYIKRVKVALRWGWGLPLIYMTTLWAAKGTILCIYFSAAAALSRRSRIGLYATTVFTVIAYINVAVFYTTNCSADDYAKLDSKICPRDERTVRSIILLVFHLLTDIMVMIMGVVVIRTMTNLGRNEIASLIFIFVLGFITIIAASVRFGVQMMYMDKRQNMSTWGHSVQLVNWISMAGLFEMDLALVAVSLPSLRVWLRRIRKKKKETLEASNESNPSNDIVRGSVGRRLSGYAEMLELESVHVETTEKT